jgi:hypothetical protein
VTEKGTGIDSVSEAMTATEALQEIGRESEMATGVGTGIGIGTGTGTEPGIELGVKVATTDRSLQLKAAQKKSRRS